MTGSRRKRAAYVSPRGQCRFCKESAPQSEMVRYGVRHLAHAVCLYQNKGFDFLDQLPTWQLRHLPILALMEAGVTLEQVRAWQARNNAEDAGPVVQGTTGDMDRE